MKFKKLLAITLTVLMAATMFVACSNNEAKTESDLEYITGKGKLVIGMTLFSPMDYYDESGELVGFEVDFGKAVCEKLGIKPEFVEINWDAKETELNAKNIDCIWNGMTITDERKENMSVSNPYMMNKQIVVAKAENAEKYKNNVAGALVVAEAGSAGEELATGNDFFKDAEYTAVDSMAKALMDVSAGTSDIAIIDYVTALGSIGEGTDFEDLVVVETESFGQEEYGIAFRKGSDMTATVNEVISALAADGTLAKIAEKYNLNDVLSAQ